jgi:hypothetical protein
MSCITNLAGVTCTADQEAVKPKGTNNKKLKKTQNTLHCAITTTTALARNQNNKTSSKYQCNY